MRLPRQPALLRCLAAMGVMAALGVGCSDSHSPTAPMPANPTPAPPGGNIGGAWIGTYNTNDFIDCDTSKSLPAQASFQQNGSTIAGMLTANGPCGLGYPFAGTLQGNKLAGDLASPPFYGTAEGTLSGTTLEMTVSNSYGYVMGQLHLHR